MTLRRFLFASRMKNTRNRLNRTNTAKDSDWLARLRSVVATIIARALDHAHRPMLGIIIWEHFQWSNCSSRTLNSSFPWTYCVYKLSQTYSNHGSFSRKYGIIAYSHDIDISLWIGRKEEPRGKATGSSQRDFMVSHILIHMDEKN